ncbi:MAG TPA: bifunctional tetrahydrofolate synthase/dihydrofolate synthase [Steroidobacteraceae bacterium]|jgi:dihydrofolate synthase/folylpolyglutamate synthase|nr:bifunctional tetrahydrofolate synthase/dihydrofolate synthase [Steroidobacteraceae bacterium]
MRSLAQWLEQQQKSHPSAIELTLSRVREVARRLDLLQPASRVVTVGGTNGKGSTVAWLDALLRAAGLRCGRFTSPHLSRYNERICIDGVEASDSSLIASFERIDAARGDITLTFFEYNALAALDQFRVSSVDVAVLEVGLGGRLDATNIIDADVAVVCSIGLDHADWLGNTLEAIGREKAGIFRQGRPAVLGSADMPGSLWNAIEVIGARAVVPGRDFFYSATGASWNFEYGELTLRGLPMPSLAGVHQLGNAATALATLKNLQVTLTHTGVSHALRTVQLGGRFQRISGKVEWILDVAHNVPAALGLAANLRALPRARTIAVCAILADKDIQGIAAALAAEVDEWILVALDGPRTVSTDEIARQLPRGARILGSAADVAAGCRMAREAAAPGERILVFGSFLTVGPALEFLGPDFLGL